MKTTKKYKVAIVDDEALFRIGLQMLIDDSDQLATHLMASDGRDCLDQLAAMASDLPDVILCDLEMPNIDGVQLTRKLQVSHPDIKVIVLSSHYDSVLILQMIEIGASAFMPKNEETEELYDTITNVIEKGFHYNQYIMNLIQEKGQYEAKSSRAPQEELTSREKEVLKKICEQKTNKEIGQELFISTRTVEGHRNKMLLKTNCKNTAGLIIYAIEQGFYKVDVKYKDW